MSRPRISRSEVIIMLLPVAGLCYLALRSGRPQPELPVPQPFQLRVVKIARLPLTAQDVSRGADTKIHVRVATRGMPPQSDFSVWDWLRVDAYLTAGHQQKPRRITDDSGKVTASGKYIFRPGTSGGGVSGGADAHYEMTWCLRLQDVPVSLGALNLQWDLDYGPSPRLMAGASGANSLNNLQPDSPALTISARVPLRKAGERTLPAHASTDPLFDVRKIEVQPIRPANQMGDTKVVLHIFYRGKLSPSRKSTLPADCQWNVVDDRGRAYGSGTHAQSAQLTSGLRRFKIVSVINTSFARRKVKNERPLALRGTISLNRAWPRQVVIPLPSRQEQ